MISRLGEEPVGGVAHSNRKSDSAIGAESSGARARDRYIANYESRRAGVSPPKPGGITSNGRASGNGFRKAGGPIIPSSAPYEIRS